jgi:hypothetical protein
MDLGRGGNAGSMMHLRLDMWVVAAALASQGACVVAKDSLGSDSAADGEDDGNADAANDEASSSGTGSAGMSGPGESATTEGSATTDGPASTGGLDPACAAVDHDTCYPAVLAACEGNGNWEVDDDCLTAVADCYPTGSDVLSPRAVILACDAELEESCLFSNAPGCGQTLCECNAGAYPYDWTNCWHILMIACQAGGTEDCGAAVTSCYPDATPAEWEICAGTIGNEIEDCDCPMCGVHEACEAALTECMNG